MRISDWSSDVCSSDLLNELRRGPVIDIAMLRRIIDDPAQPDVAAVGADRTNLIRLVVLEEQSLCIAIGLDLVVIEDARVALVGRSEERRVGEECVSTGRSRGAACPLNKNTK